MALAPQLFDLDESVPRAGDGGRQDSEVTALQHYLSSLRGRGTLEKEDEARLAKAIQESREAIAEILIGLPEYWRRLVLADNADGPSQGRKWPLRQLDGCCTRLLELADRPAAKGLMPAITSVRCRKEQLDEAREALILANLPLVIYMAKKARNRGVPFLDLIQEGNIGLMTAVEKYEWERGYRFSTYAVWWIRNGLTRAMIERSRLVRLPARQRDQIATLKRHVGDAIQGDGSRPTVRGELAALMQMDESEVIDLLAMAREPVPLEAPANDSDRTGPLGIVPDKRAVDPLAVAEESLMRERVEAALQSLPTVERRILKLRFGIDTDEPRTLRQIGEVFNLSRERIRQLERLALAKLRARNGSLGEFLWMA